MKFIRSLIVSFSMYSKIPMPQFKWKDEDMKYMLCFFPWVGAVIAILLYTWNIISTRYEIGKLAYSLVGLLIPLVITGGFHLDGFMDTIDALKSYQNKERKLEILKDSHIGAFSVISLVIYGLIYLACLSEIENKDLLKLVGAGFFLARCLSGISVISFPKAKKEGLLFLFADKSEKNFVKVSLYLQMITCLLFMLYSNFFAGLLIIVSAFSTFFYYYYLSKKEFGGITGDTAGYFLVICECFITLVIAFVDIILF